MSLRGRGTREGTAESLWELELEPPSGTQYFMDPLSQVHSQGIKKVT